MGTLRGTFVPCQLPRRRLTSGDFICAGSPAWRRRTERQDDERAESLRQAGAETFVGVLLTIADVTTALKGCRGIYFGLSLSPYYTDAVSLMAAAARTQGDIEVFVNMSEFEESFMTFEKMTAPEAQWRSWLGGLVANWSPQQRAH